MKKSVMVILKKTNLLTKAERAELTAAEEAYEAYKKSNTGVHHTHFQYLQELAVSTVSGTQEGTDAAEETAEDTTAFDEENL